MKQLFAGILFFLLAIQSFYPVAIYSMYFANKNYIANVLCENIAVPELNCEGSCFVNKQLKKAEESKQESKSGIVIQVVLGLAPEFILAKKEVLITPISSFPLLHQSVPSSGYNTSCFRPPRA